MENLFIPSTLIEAITFYSEEKNCFDTMVATRWPKGIRCPRCAHADCTLFATKPVFKCNGCKKQFTVKVGTIFEDSPLSLTKWLPAVWLITNAKNGISSCEVARAVGVCQKTAWFMLHRIRHAMQTGSFEKFSGVVEADESPIGGLEKNKHENKKLHGGHGSVGKTIIQAFIQRADGDKPKRVRAKLLTDVGGPAMKGGVRQNVQKGSTLYTDGAYQYRGLSKEYIHEFIDHHYKCVRGSVHTNSLENYFSLLKRTIKGTYVAIEPYHLTRYCDEQSFRSTSA
jgi:transposase-like protein